MNWMVTNREIYIIPFNYQNQLRRKQNLPDLRALIQSLIYQSPNKKVIEQFQGKTKVEKSGSLIMEF